MWNCDLNLKRGCVLADSTGGYMKVVHFFDKDTFTLSYVVHNEGQSEAIVIDPVWDYDPASGKLTEASVHKIIDYLKQNNLTPVINIDTHAHADHLSGSQILKKYYPKMQVAVSERIKIVQGVFAKVFNIENEFKDSHHFDRLIKDFEEIKVSGLTIKAIPTPGHTPACTSYLIEDAVFTGDTIFMPDSGTGRSDFPGGSTKDLYKSITQNLYTLPDSTKVFVGHDYQPGGRELAFQTTIGDLKKANFQLKANTPENEFVSFQDKRDAGLNAPRLLLPSIQVNIRAGRLPTRESNGTQYLKIPLKVVE